MDRTEAQAILDEDWIPANSWDGLQFDGTQIRFYRQPGGCVEAVEESLDGDSDILHFCDDDAAKAFTAKFVEFIDQTAPNYARREAAAAVVYGRA
ncbi:hypothetical protein [Kineosporia babensis]|uniref:Uncharacterized protein n=1 Tax=Kineosporia babensis TaxID=499548 RepID=A0A9X1SSQ4_9ACTN|nr:hypothetical protein [Kineosporia babensis]MCD5310824.1 hypothetical protein [Kineosporia babensis]